MQRLYSRYRIILTRAHCRWHSTPTLGNWPFRTFWDYPFEEVGELWAQLLFLLSFLVVLDGRLGQLGAKGAAS